MHQVNVKICRGNLLSFLILAFSSLFRINEDLIRIIDCERGRRRHPHGADEKLHAYMESSTTHKIRKNGRRDFG